MYWNITSCSLLHRKMSGVSFTCFAPLFMVEIHGLRTGGAGRGSPTYCVGVGWHLVTQVLPMGFINSVAIPQHVHRRVITQALTSEKRLASGHQELRRDRGFSSANHLYRVYLDNYGELADNPGAKGRGSGGTAAPKGDKVLKYARLACELLVRGRASQKELHIVGGGFVYIAMFRRHCWQI